MNKKLTMVLVVIMFILSLTAFHLTAEDNTVPKKALKLEKKGDTATNSKEYDQAMEFYRQALEIHPDMDSVHYKIASIHAFRKNYAEALDSLRLSMKINPANEKAKRAFTDTVLKHGSALLQNRQIEDANALFMELSEIEGLKNIDPKLVTELDYRIGFNYFQLQKAAESNEYLLKFIDNTDSADAFPAFYSTAHYLTGLNYSQLNQIENSNNYLTSFLELAGENPENKFIGFARYIIGMNNYNVLKEKIETIEKSKDRKNLDESNKKILELANAETGVEENLLYAVKNIPDLEDAYVLLGNYFYLKKDIENSIKYYSMLVEKFPGSADIEVYKVFLKDLEKQKAQK